MLNGSLPSLGGPSSEEVHNHVWTIPQDTLTWRERVILFAFALCYRPGQEEIPMNYQRACCVMPFLNGIERSNWSEIVYILGQKGFIECTLPGNQWKPSEYRLAFLEAVDTSD